MNVLWSPHAERLLDDIVIEIAIELSVDDGLRWEAKLRTAASQLADFPNIGTAVPTECFHAVPPCADQLRQLICKPYRIVYEVAENEIHVLSIRHSRMLVTATDTYWN